MTPAVEAAARAICAAQDIDPDKRFGGRLAWTYYSVHARAALATAESCSCIEEIVRADSIIRHAIPERFILVPPDGGDVKTVEAVQALVEENERLREALEPFVPVSDLGYHAEEPVLLSFRGGKHLVPGPVWGAFLQARAVLSRIAKAPT